MITGVLNDGYLMKMMYEDTFKSKQSLCGRNGKCSQELDKKNKSTDHSVSKIG